MKVFLYDTLEDADSENQLFGSIVNNIWATPFAIISGSNTGKYWLPYDEGLVSYSATGKIEDQEYDELYKDDQPVPFFDHPNIIA